VEPAPPASQSSSACSNHYGPEGFVSTSCDNGDVEPEGNPPPACPMHHNASQHYENLRASGGYNPWQLKPEAPESIIGMPQRQVGRHLEPGENPNTSAGRCEMDMDNTAEVPGGNFNYSGLTTTRTQRQTRYRSEESSNEDGYWSRRMARRNMRSDRECKEADKSLGKSRPRRRCNHGRDHLPGLAKGAARGQQCETYLTALSI
jgi:hypothetical protein